MTKMKTKKETQKTTLVNTFSQKVPWLIDNPNHLKCPVCRKRIPSMVTLKSAPYHLGIRKIELYKLLIKYENKIKLYFNRMSDDPNISPLLDLRTIPQLPRTIHKRLTHYESLQKDKPRGSYP